MVRPTGLEPVTYGLEVRGSSFLPPENQLKKSLFTYKTLQYRIPHVDAN